MLRAMASAYPAPLRLNHLASIPSQRLWRGSNLASDDFTVAEPNTDMALEDSLTGKTPLIGPINLITHRRSIRAWDFSAPSAIQPWPR